MYITDEEIKCAYRNAIDSLIVIKDIMEANDEDALMELYDEDEEFKELVDLFEEIVG